MSYISYLFLLCIAMFTLPPLPYELNALAPVCSAETLEYHYHKHHQAYIDKLNALLASDTTHSEGTSQ
jgi:Fe-Mn family superoxide dismutase